MTSQEVERIAQAAITLCAELLRRYQPTSYPEDGFVLVPPTLEDRIEDWGRQVVAWQQQLDTHTRRTP